MFADLKQRAEHKTYPSVLQLQSQRRVACFARALFKGRWTKPKDEVTQLHGSSNQLRLTFFGTPVRRVWVRNFRIFLSNGHSTDFNVKQLLQQQQQRMAGSRWRASEVISLHMSHFKWGQSVWLVHRNCLQARQLWEANILMHSRTGETACD